jgi:hypothetical protein
MSDYKPTGWSVEEILVIVTLVLAIGWLLWLVVVVEVWLI